MKIIPYDVNYPNYDKQLPINNRLIREHINQSNDDYLILAVGETGTGKSNLLLHLQELYMEELTSIKCVAQNRESYADVIKYNRDAPMPRVAFFDESNISKRDGQSSFNKDIIDLFYTIRAKNILHLWATPSLDMIDKPLIYDRIKAVILFPSKQKNIRPYFWFKKSQILAIFEKYGRLHIDLLTKVRKKYCSYRGYFREYNGIIKDEYLSIKNQRVDDKMDEFANKYSNNGNMYSKFTLNQNKLSKIFMVSNFSIAETTKLLMDEGKLNESNFFINAMGKRFFTNETIEIFKEKFKEQQKSINLNDILSHKPLSDRNETNA